MGNIENIKNYISAIISEKKHAQSESTEPGEKVYSDEPILFTAAQMGSYTPQKCLEMRKLARNNISEMQIFYRQAKFMEDFEDDYTRREEFFRYYPTYQAMSNRQLRSYFTWRTAVRRGEIKKAPLSFAYVYIYELLNLVGADSPLDAHKKLKAFSKSYSEVDGSILYYVKQWLNDLCVYYALPTELLELPEAVFSEELSVLAHSEAHTHAEVFAALCKLSSYNLLNSPFYKKHTDEVEQVVMRCYESLKKYYAANRKNGLNERLFGKALTSHYYPFMSAIVFEEKRHADCVYKVSDVLSYSCVDGEWRCEKFFMVKNKSKPLGALLKCVDYKMRQKTGFKSTMKPVETTKVFSRAVDSAVEEFYNELAEKAKPKIEIDVSKLQSIREVSLVTQSKLIVDEELPPELPRQPEESKALGTTEVLGTTEALGTAEKGFLRCLLRGENVQNYCRENGVMLSVIVDRINEELFENFGDTVLDYDGDVPFVIEDYIGEVKGLLNL